MTEKVRTDNRFAYFSLLKFIGAFSIAIFLHYNDHLLPGLGEKNPFAGNMILWALTHESCMFVEMYFIISGILFVTAYQKKIDGGMGFDFFLLKRAARIYPVVILTSLFMYLANGLLYICTRSLWSTGTSDLMELVIDMLFAGKPVFGVPNTLNAPIWYINVLLLCYVIAYVLVKFAKQYKTELVFLLPILVGIAVQYRGGYFPLLNQSTARGFVAFFTGVFLGKLFEAVRAGQNRALLVLRGLALAGFCLAVGIRACPWYEALIHRPYQFYALIVFPCLIVLLYDCRWLNRLCSTKGIKWLGNISFSMYLWNFPICISMHLLIVTGVLPLRVTSWGFFVLFAAVHFLVAGLSWRYLDAGLSRRLGKLVEDKFGRQEGVRA